MRRSGLYKESRGEHFRKMEKSWNGTLREAMAEAQRDMMGSWVRVVLVELNRFEIDFQDGNDKIC